MVRNYFFCSLIVWFYSCNSSPSKSKFRIVEKISDSIHNTVKYPVNETIAVEAASFESYNRGKLKVVGNNVWIRKGPHIFDYFQNGGKSEENRIIAKLNQGNVCEIIQKGNFELINGNADFWYKIKFNYKNDRLTGWIFGSQTDIRLPSKIMYTIDDNKLNLYLQNRAGSGSLLDNSESFKGAAFNKIVPNLSNYTLQDEGDPIGFAGKITFNKGKILLLSYFSHQAYGIMSYSTGTEVFSINHNTYNSTNKPLPGVLLDTLHLANENIYLLLFMKKEIVTTAMNKGLFQVYECNPQKGHLLLCPMDNAKVSWNFNADEFYSNKPEFEIIYENGRFRKKNNEIYLYLNGKKLFANKEEQNYVFEDFKWDNTVHTFQ